MTLLDGSKCTTDFLGNIMGQGPQGLVMGGLNIVGGSSRSTWTLLDWCACSEILPQKLSVVFGFKLLSGYGLILGLLFSSEGFFANGSGF